MEQQGGVDGAVEPSPYSRGQGAFRAASYTSLSKELGQGQELLGSNSETEA